MNDTLLAPPIRLTQFSHGGGCGCKISPAVLRDILADTPFASQLAAAYPDLLVGIEHGDDAAVYRLNDEQAIVATTDFFMPIVDDPFEFGRIAATNALSDVYAMGGRPLFALAIVGMPIGKLPNDVIRQILAGGESVCKAAGIPIAGGHSIDAPEPIYGLVGIGVVDPAPGQAEHGRPGRRRPHPRQAAGRRHLQRRAEEGPAERRPVRGHDRRHHPAQHRRHRPCRHSMAYTR